MPAVPRVIIPTGGETATVISLGTTSRRKAPLDTYRSYDELSQFDLMVPKAGEAFSSIPLTMREELQPLRSSPPGEPPGGPRVARARLDAVRSYFKEAHGAREGRDRASAVRSFLAALRELESPIDARTKDSPPLYRCLTDGEQLWSEAVLGASAFATSEDCWIALPRLHQIEKRARAKLSGIRGVLYEHEKLLEAVEVQSSSSAKQLKRIKSERDGLSARIRELQRERDVTEALLFRARITRGDLLMRYGAEVEVPQVRMFSRAAELFNGVLGDIYTLSTDRHAGLRLAAEELLLEAFARQAERAYTRGDKRAFADVFERLKRQALIVADDYASIHQESDIINESMRAQVARCLADVSILLARMKITGAALDGAHAVTTSPLFKDTKASQRLLKEDLFQNYVHQDGKRILSPAEAGADASWLTRVWEGLRASLANTDMKPGRESLIGGAIGMSLALGTEYALTGTMHALPAMAAAALASTGVRFVRGGMTPQARSAYELGSFDRSTADSAKDAGNIVLSAGFSALGWGVPAVLISHIPEADPVVRLLEGAKEFWWDRALMGGVDSVAQASLNLFSNGLASIDAAMITASVSAFDNPLAYTSDFLANALAASSAVLYGTYLSFPQWRGALKDVFESNIGPFNSLRGLMGLIAMAMPGALYLANNYSPADLAHMACGAYMASAGLVYASYIGSYMFGLPQWREALKSKSTLLYVPGAVMLGAHLGTLISDKHTFEWRNVMGAFGVLAGITMLYVSGTIPIKRKNGESWLAARWREFSSANHNQLVGIGLMVGVSNAIGGIILDNIAPGSRPTSIAVNAMMGAAITACLLPIVMGVSGVMKQQLPLFAEVRNAWHDARDDHLFRRLYETTRAAGSSFRYPYSVNRFGRSGSLDIPAATVGTFLGWDALGALVAREAVHGTFSNPTSTMMKNEVGGTDFQMDPLMDVLRPARDGGDIDQGKLRDHLNKSGVHMSLLHFVHFFGHKWRDIKNWAYPFVGIQRVWNPPEFPMPTEPYYFSKLYEYLSGQMDLPKEKQITANEMSALLDEVACLSCIKENRELMAATLKVIYKVSLLTDDKEKGLKASPHRAMVDQWLTKNAWLFEVLDVDRSTIAPPDTKMRWRQKKQVRREVKTPLADYAQSVDAYRTREIHPPISYRGTKAFLANVDRLKLIPRHHELMPALLREIYKAHLWEKGRRQRVLRAWVEENEHLYASFNVDRTAIEAPDDQTYVRDLNRARRRGRESLRFYADAVEERLNGVDAPEAPKATAIHPAKLNAPLIHDLFATAH